VVSALGRDAEAASGRALRGLIQTDAAMPPGSAGGALLDSCGRLIGVNLALGGPSGRSAGVGFALPVDEVNRVVPELIKHGRVARPLLGAELAPDAMARDLQAEGAVVLSLLTDGPAAKAGLRPVTRGPGGRTQLGDVIVAVDGQPVRRAADVFAAVEKRQPGDEVVLTVRRGDKQEMVKVTLGAAR
jgi:S1-C subfamily serine protease